MFKFTPKQGRYLAFIYHYTQVNRRPPAEADIQRYFGVTPPTVHAAVLKLAEKGLISRNPGRARSIEVLVPVEQLPLLGEVGKSGTEAGREENPQLQMVWPTLRLASPPTVQLAAGYSLRTYQPGDEPRFYTVMDLAGWPEWDDRRLQPWLSRILPDGWFMILDEASGKIVATAMCLHNYKETHPFQGELGWLACDPAHRGKGLGLAASAAVTARFIKAGYRNISLYTEDYRLAALKTYLKLGYVPLIVTTEMLGRWRGICEQLEWPLIPEQWQAQIDE